VTDATDAFATAADEGWATAAAVATARPTEITAAGLPRRRPMAHHIPGSIPPPRATTRTTTRPARAAGGRDAGTVRRNLAAYQRGLHEGRRRAAPPTDTPPHAPTTTPSDHPRQNPREEPRQDPGEHLDQDPGGHLDGSEANR
jgi:hypothetical protein